MTPPNPLPGSEALAAVRRILPSAEREVRAALADAGYALVSNPIERQGRGGNCPRCGCYVPMRVNGDSRTDHDCKRTPPSDGLPLTLYACPTCGGHGCYAWGCWGTREHPHPHCYMRPVHELVAELRTVHA